MVILHQISTDRSEGNPSEQVNNDETVSLTSEQVSNANKQIVPFQSVKPTEKADEGTICYFWEIFNNFRVLNVILGINTLGFSCKWCLIFQLGTERVISGSEKSPQVTIASMNPEEGTIYVNLGIIFD